MADSSLAARQAFWQAVALVLGLVATVALFLLALRERQSEWAQYQRLYAQMAGTHAAPSATMPVLRPEIVQIDLPNLHRVDRCPTCHLGMTDTRMAGAPMPFTQHSPLLASHPPERLGCTICHDGEGRAVTLDESHGAVPGQHARLLPASLQTARCFLCHGLEGLPEAQTQVVAEGVKLFNLYRCLRCHQVDGNGGSIGPDLSTIASQRDWVELYAHLLKPDALVPGSTMPDFGLRRAEATGLTAFLLTRLDPRQGVRDAEYLAMEVQAPETLERSATASVSPAVLTAEYNGRRLYAGLGCPVCHRVGLEGGSIGPSLTHIGLAREPSWLRDLLLDPGQTFPDGQMPGLELTQAEVAALVDYLSSLR